MGEWKDKLQGKAREIKGKVSDDRLEELKGKAQQARGEAKGKIDDLKNAWERHNAEESDANEADRSYAGEGYDPETDQPAD
jgi:uncharacterized protein YjbJ (UPF0337 family)